MAVAERAPHGRGAADLVVDIGAGGEHREPLRAVRARERAAGKDADVEHAHMVAPAGGDNAGEILRLPTGGRARPGGARIDRVVIDLGGVETAAVDDLDAG